MITITGKRFLYRIFPPLLLLWIFFGQMAGAAPALPSDSYTLKLFTEDTVLRNPNGSVSGYFELYPGSAIAEPAVLDLWYTYSPTTRVDLSAMTVSVNGIPVASRFLLAQEGRVSNWQIPLPVNHFRTGPNEISISVVHRTIDGLCRDIDNPANWFIIRPETRVSFNVARSPYTLSSYPRPFLDEYLASKINTVFYVPDDPDEAMLAALFTLAADWGARGPAGVPQRLEVRLGAAGQVPANEIVLSQDTASALNFSGLPNGYSRLLITGENSGSMAAAMNALSRPQLVKTFFGQQMVLSSPLPPDSTNGVKGKKEAYTLSDLGYENDITAAGAFHQEAIFNIQRPPNYKIGDGSYIELHFRHSPILDPKKSAVTIYVNDIPIRATALTAENAERGILKAPIPASELNKPSWRVRFGFYHDLGIVDCSKNYDEVAWSVVEKETTVFLAPGKIEYIPALEDFPNNFSVTPDEAVNLTMLLPDRPSQEEISAAFKLAYFIGQQNRSKIVWQVQSASSFDAKKASGTVIALGRNTDADQWKALKKYLPIFPDAEGVYHVAPWVEAMPDAMPALDIYQIGKIDDDKLLYAFMYVSPDRMNNLLNYALANGSFLAGQLTLVDAQGNHVSFYQQPPKKSGSSGFAWLASILSSANGVAGTYLAVFIVVLAATLALTFFMRKRS